MKEDAAAFAVVDGDFAIASPKLFIPADTTRYYGLQGRLKRVFDLVATSVILVVVSPLMLLIALLVKYGSSGPVLFVQERLGRDGKPFKFYKFRSMEHNSDDAIHRQFVAMFIGGDEGGCAESNAGDKVFKMKQDPRVTPIGSLLRKTSLDELPQLFNILKGEMSLVGPRPPIAYEIENYPAVAHGTPEGRARTDRSVAGQRPQQRLVRGDGPAGRPLHQPVVAVAGFRHPRQDRPRRPEGYRRLLGSAAVGRDPPSRPIILFLHPEPLIPGFKHVRFVTINWNAHP